jgi:hypothetical protein
MSTHPSAPLFPKFVSEGAAIYHELRKRGTSHEPSDHPRIDPCAAGAL